MAFKLAEVYTDLTVKGQAGLQSKLTSVKASLGRVQDAANRVGAAARGMFVKMAAAAAGVLFLTIKEEQAIFKFRAALDAGGYGADKFGDKLVAVANKLEILTATDMEQILGLMKLALNMGATADSVEEVTKQAMGLASAFDMDLASAVKNVMLAQAGEYTMLSRYVPALRSATTETEKLAIFNKAVAAGWKSAQTEANPFKRMMLDLGNLTKDIGRAILPAVNTIIEAIRRVVQAIQKWVAENPKLTTTLVAIAGVATLAVGAIALLTPVISAVIGAVTGLITVLTFLAANPIVLVIAAIIALVAAAIYFRDYIVLAFTAASYQITKWANQVIHFFGTVLPQYFMWFVDNVGNLFTTLANFFKTVLNNMWTNAQNFFTSLKDWFAGDEFNFKWTGLLEGFKSTLEALPEIAKRKIGPIEAMLAKDVERLARDAKGRWFGKGGEPGKAAPELEGLEGAAGTGKGDKAKDKKDAAAISIIGIPDLAKKLQEAAGKKADESKKDRQHAALVSTQEKGNKLLEKVAKNTEIPFGMEME